MPSELRLSSLGWVVERQGVKTDKDSDIVNDANDWAIETMRNPRYPLGITGITGTWNYGITGTP